VTKTEKLRAALLSRGFSPVEHASTRECLKGLTTGSKPLWVWPDRAGGARYSLTGKKTESHRMGEGTIKLLLEGKPSKVIPGGTA